MEPNISKENIPQRESWKEMGEDLYKNLYQLWSKENELVRTELNEKFSDVKSAVSSLAIGVALLLVGLFSFVATSIIVLDLYIELWLAAVIVTLVFIFAGGIAFILGKNKLEIERLKPKHSIDAMGEIKNTFQEKFHEFQRH